MIIGLLSIQAFHTKFHPNQTQIVKVNVLGLFRLKLSAEVVGWPRMVGEKLCVSSLVTVIL